MREGENQGEINLSLSTTKKSLSAALTAVTELVRDHLAPDELLRFQLAFQEVLMNSFEHGNLGISAEEKKSLCEQGGLEEAHATRAVAAQAASKMIVVRAVIAPGEFRASIADDGDGFDWRGATERARSQKCSAHGDILAPSGRGLSIINAVFDTVTYNEKGNEVTVVKKLRSC